MSACVAGAAEPARRLRAGACELRLGDWKDVLGDLQADAVITDPPFSRRTAQGYRSGSRIQGQDGSEPESQYTIDYGCIDAHQMEVLCAWATRVSRYWVVIFCDHIAVHWALRSLALFGWYTFAPVVWVKSNPPPRFLADGPASGCEYLAVARRRMKLPKERRKSRPGYYVCGREIGSHGFVGQKPDQLMRTVVRDYTLYSDLVVDPYAGTGSTLLAAGALGRRAIGSEVDPETFNLASDRLQPPQHLLPCAGAGAS